jgi:hypothetical protein
MAQIPKNSVTFIQQVLELKNKKECDGCNLSSEELLQKMSKHDYSSIWLQQNDAIIGFIGENFQRIRVKFTSIVKSTEDSTKYHVFGKSMVKDNICVFIGEIKLLHVR